MNQPNQNPYNNYNYQQNGAYYRPQMTEAQYQHQLYLEQTRRARSKEMTEIFTAGLALGVTLIVNLILQAVGVGVLQVMGKYELFESSFLYQHSANIIIVDVVALIIPFFIMSQIFKRRYVTPVVPREKVGFVTGAAWVFAGLAVCLGANIVTNGVINLFKQFGYELTQFDTLKPNSPLECVLLVFSTAVAPAICEEFAMRCASLGLLRKHGKAFAVVAVSIVFGLLHGNVIQFVFAFIIGLVLGYVTIVTDSVVPAMFIHGFNNGLSVTQDILKYAMSEKMATTIVAVIMIAILGIAAGSVVYLLVTKQFLPKKEATKSPDLKVNFFVKLVLLIPGLFVPFVILIYLTSKTIVPIS